MECGHLAMLWWFGQCVVCDWFGSCFRIGLLLVLDFVGWFLCYFGRVSVVCFGLGFCSAI